MATRIKNIPFVGGDTATFEFDFGTKVASSVVECPMKLYFTASSSLKNPTNGWSEVGADGNQVAIDGVKSLDGKPLGVSNNISGNILQYLIELDLTPLCNALFGGATSAMRTAMKKIDCTAYAKGSGVGGNLATMKIWSNSASIWAGLATNNSSSISAMEVLVLDNNCAVFATNDNRLYFILYANASDGTTYSEVDLDYVNIKLSFARVPDVIAPVPITLPATWSMLIKGFSPVWDSTDTGSRVIFSLQESVSACSFQAKWENGKFLFFSNNALQKAVAVVYADIMSFKKFQSINFLVEKTSSGLRFSILINNQVFKRYMINSVALPTAVYKLYLLSADVSGYNADAFLNSLVFLPNKTFDDDTEAESVLRGTAEGFENDELFDISKVNLDSHATIQGNSIVLNATATYQASMVWIPVLPNNQYELKFTMNNSLNSNDKGYIDAYERYGGAINLIAHYVAGGSALGQHDYVFTTGNKTNCLVLSFLNNTVGTFTWSDISLKLKM